MVLIKADCSQKQKTLSQQLCSENILANSGWDSLSSLGSPLLI